MCVLGRLNKDDSNVGMAAQESKCEQKDNGIVIMSVFNVLHFHV